MSEWLPSSPELLSPAESITGAMEYWLSEEIRSSMTGSNAYLDNFDTFIADGRAKTLSHYNRLEHWTEQFAKDPTDMRAFTLQIFGIQTGLSGAFRTQCYILANSPEDYARRRTNSPLGVSVETEVEKKLLERFGKMPDTIDLCSPTVTVPELIVQTASVNFSRLTTLEKLAEDPRHKQGLSALNHAIRLIRLQKQWLRLGVDYLIYATHLNGGKLDNLEFLEPLPITKAQTYKPFVS